MTRPIAQDPTRNANGRNPSSLFEPVTGSSQFEAWLSILRAADSTNDSWWTNEASDPDIELCYRPTGPTTVTDLTGNTTVTSVKCRPLLPDGKGLIAFDSATAGAPPIFYGDMTTRVIYYAISTDADTRALYILATGETEPTNIQVDVLIRPAAGEIDYMHEYGAGQNAGADFTIVGLDEGAILFADIVRKDNGDGTVDVSLYYSINGADVVAAVVSSTTGTNNGTSATVPINTGGTTAVVQDLMDGTEGQAAWPGVLYYSGAKSISDTQAALDALASAEADS